MILEIERRNSPDSLLYKQRIQLPEMEPNATVATALTWINTCAVEGTLYDMNGRKVDPVRWQCSCLHKKCGACAMVIDGRPALACDTKLSGKASDVMKLGPLKKFPLIADLLVARSGIYHDLDRLATWLDLEVNRSNTSGSAVVGPELTDIDPERHSYVDEKDQESVYDASRCLHCGLCLEVCPNFYIGGDFTGPTSTVELSRLLMLTEGEEKDKLAKQFRKYVFEGCGKSLSCVDICPAGIDIQALMVRSNAASVWKRLSGKK